MMLQKVEGKEYDEFMAKRCSKKKVQLMVEEFWNSSNDVMKVVFNNKEYKSVKSAYSSFHLAVKRMKIRVKVLTCQNELYLMKLK